PGAVFAPYRDVDVNGKPAAGVAVSRPKYPPVVAHFDKQTKRLVQVTYEGLEGEKKVNKQLVIYSHKEFDGITLPEKVAVMWNGQTFAEWTVTKVEFPSALDPALFEKP
ncbi:MAG TPA: hypothetical protein VHI52_03360, partial [Verrucomicrobiae bacterium]|nr:hypothetical protein [Verrucomicrobiae bacterium]